MLLPIIITLICVLICISVLVVLVVVYDTTRTFILAKMIKLYDTLLVNQNFQYFLKGFLKLIRMLIISLIDISEVGIKWSIIAVLGTSQSFYDRPSDLEYLYFSWYLFWCIIGFWFAVAILIILFWVIVYHIFFLILILEILVSETKNIWTWIKDYFKKK